MFGQWVGFGTIALSSSSLYLAAVAHCEAAENTSTPDVSEAWIITYATSGEL